MVPVLISRNENCCGCKACANACPQNAISFKADEYGFFYPVIDEQKCIGCNKCVKTCEFQKEENNGNEPLKSVAARHKEAMVYCNSTSGGVFTAFAQYVLEKKGVVYGCVIGDDMVPKHVAAETEEQIAGMRGSKYVQSDTGLVYREVLDNLKAGRWVLFTGTPCQVAALNSFLGNTDTTQLLTVDILCHGVPSPGVFAKYIDYLTRKYGRKITNFQFRNKRFDWERPVINVSFDKGKDKWWFTTEDVFYSNFNKGNFHRPGCFNCKYACLKRYGDVTIGDFWGYQKANIKMSSKEGISCCLLNTKKALDIIKELPIQAEEVDLNVIVQRQPRLREHGVKSPSWEPVMNSIRDNGFEPLAKSFNRTHRKAFLKAFVKKLVLKPLNGK